MDLKNRDNWVAIIGSRNPSQAEINASYNLGLSCAKQGKIVVSGLADGIDGAGHRGAIAGGGKTIALVHTVMSSPIYPPKNRALAEEIKKNGCIIYPFKTRPTFNFKEISQNRLRERSMLNAYVCPNIVVIKDGDICITGGTKWATNYGTKIGHKVFRFDSNYVWHENPEVEKCEPWWMMEIDFEGFLKELDNM